MGPLRGWHLVDLTTAALEHRPRRATPQAYVLERAGHAARGVSRRRRSHPPGLRWDSAGSRRNDLTAAAGAPASVSDPAGYVRRTRREHQRVVCRGADQPRSPSSLVVVDYASQVRVTRTSPAPLRGGHRKWISKLPSTADFARVESALVLSGDQRSAFARPDRRLAQDAALGRLSSAPSVCLAKSHPPQRDFYRRVPGAQNDGFNRRKGHQRLFDLGDGPFRSRALRDG